jgi:hypothetical protein
MPVLQSLQRSLLLSHADAAWQGAAARRRRAE